MNFQQSIQTVFRKYAEFQGRAGRSEFWWWVLFTFLAGCAIGAVSAWTIQLSGGAVTGPDLSALWGLAILLPSIAVSVRRLRDAGFGWGHVCWLLLPLAGIVILAVLCAQPSRLVAAPQSAATPVYEPVRG